MITYYKDQVKEDEIGRECNMNGKRKNVYRISGRKATRKEATKKTKKGWVNDVKEDLREIACGGMDWINLS
jgi:hypothetical protein